LQGGGNVSSAAGSAKGGRTALSQRDKKDDPWGGAKSRCFPLWRRGRRGRRGACFEGVKKAGVTRQKGVPYGVRNRRRLEIGGKGNHEKVHGSASRLHGEGSQKKGVKRGNRDQVFRTGEEEGRKG